MNGNQIQVSYDDIAAAYSTQVNDLTRALAVAKAETAAVMRLLQAAQERIATLENESESEGEGESVESGWDA